MCCAVLCCVEYVCIDFRSSPCHFTFTCMCMCSWDTGMLVVMILFSVCLTPSHTNFFPQSRIYTYIHNYTCFYTHNCTCTCAIGTTIHRDFSVNPPLLDDFSKYCQTLMSTGNHPLERAIRKYLISGRFYQNTFIPQYLKQSEGNTPSDEMEYEDRLDKNDILRLEAKE